MDPPSFSMGFGGRLPLPARDRFVRGPRPKTSRTTRHVLPSNGTGGARPPWRLLGRGLWAGAQSASPRRMEVHDASRQMHPQPPWPGAAVIRSIGRRPRPDWEWKVPPPCNPQLILTRANHPTHYAPQVRGKRGGRPGLGWGGRTEGQPARRSDPSLSRRGPRPPCGSRPLQGLEMDGQRMWTCGVGCCSGCSGAGTGGQAGPFEPEDRTGRVLRIETAAAGGGRCHLGAGPGPVKLVICDRLILEAQFPLCALCLDPTSRAGPCHERSNQPPTPDTRHLGSL